MELVDRTGMTLGLYTLTDSNINKRNSLFAMINEEGLRDWFGKSKSKDGKKGWVNVVTGDSQCK